MKINPAILVDSPEELRRQLSVVSAFVKEVDIDIIDWTRTPNKTIKVEDALAIDIQLRFNFDLMEDYPSASIEKALTDSRTNRIIINSDAKEEPHALVNLIRSKHKSVGLSLNPDGPAIAELEKLFPRLDSFDLIQVMTIKPGKQGNPFMRERLEVVKELRKHKFSGLIEIDGGVNTATLPMVMAYPLDIVSVGSAISKAADPKAAFYGLLDIVEKYSQR